MKPTHNDFIYSFGYTYPFIHVLPSPFNNYVFHPLIRIEFLISLLGCFAGIILGELHLQRGQE